MHLRLLSLLLLGLVASGCSSDNATELVERYAKRTANAINIDIDLRLEKPASLYASLPERRRRLAPVPEIHRGLLDLLNLRHCNLLSLVAERNSSLGRLAQPSQRLIYELKVLPALRSCVVELGDQPDFIDLKAQLTELISIKERGFEPLLFNAIYNTDEMEQHFSLGAPPLEPSQPGQFAPIRDTLSRFHFLASISDQPDWEPPSFTEDLEHSYEQLYRSEFGARWLASMALLTQTLQQVSSAIEQRLNERPICFNQKANNQSAILWNVFQKYYVGELQPYIAEVERDGGEWSRMNLAILHKLNGLPQSQLITGYFKADSAPGIWSDYLYARERHTTAWQAILEQCGMRPGVAADN